MHSGASLRGAEFRLHVKDQHLEDDHRNPPSSPAVPARMALSIGHDANRLRSGANCRGRRAMSWYTSSCPHLPSPPDGATVAQARSFRPSVMLIWARASHGEAELAARQIREAPGYSITAMAVHVPPTNWRSSARDAPECANLKRKRRTGRWRCVIRICKPGNPSASIPTSPHGLVELRWRSGTPELQGSSEPSGGSGW
jgi:hypothetical protein